MTPEDPKQIWQNQEREHPPASVIDIHVRAALSHAKVRRNLAVTFIFGFAVLALCVVAIVTIPLTPGRLIAGTMMLVVAAVMVKAYKRFWSVEKLSYEAGLNTCIQYYRNELQSQYRSVLLRWQLLLPVVVLLWLTSSSVMGSYSHVIMRFLLPALFLLTFFVRRREVKVLRRELDSLRDVSQ